MLAELRAAGLVRTSAPAVDQLTGGVSSEILVVDDGGRKLVAKRALAQLRVRDDWFADTARSRVELAYLRRADAIVPGCTPRILYSPPHGDWFAMEFLEAGFTNWKSLLLAGRAAGNYARSAGTVLGRIHGATWGDPAVAREFSTLANFRQLRLDPYLETTAIRVPDLAAPLRQELNRLAHTELALVHGDFSPKNLLVSTARVVVLDAEVAWFGDPAFDPAFLLTHVHLKGLLHAASPDPLLALGGVFWSAYVDALGDVNRADLEARTVRLLLCLMLARVHGKSPVEYLSPGQQALVTTFVRSQLPRPPASLSLLTAAWRDQIRP